MATTTFGTCAFLICGDLFDDALLQLTAWSRQEMWTNGRIH